MRLFIRIVLCLMLFPFAVSAQFTPVTHLTGSASYSGHSIGVTGAGTSSSISFCGTDPYWIGSGTGSTPTPGSYTFTFSPAVNALRLLISAADVGESITVAINGTRYTLTAANLFAFSGTCGEPPLTLSGDTLLSAGVAGAKAVGLNILQCGITSATIATNGLQNGSVFTLMFSDTSACNIVTNNGPLCLGDTLKLDAAATSYAWSGPNSFSSTLGNPIRLAVTYADSGLYRVIKDGRDTLYTRVVIKPDPAVVATTNSPVCVGDSLFLWATSPLTGVSYSWVGRTNGFTSTAQNDTIVNVTTTQAGVYKVSATLNGCTAYDSVLVNVISVPPPVITSNSPVCAGDSLVFTASDTNAAATFSWTVPGGLTSTRQNPVFTGVTIANSGIVTATAIFGGCTSLPTTINVTVNPLPAIVVTPTDPTPCISTDGRLLLAGLLPSNNYNVAYKANGSWVSTTATADGSGNINLYPLVYGVYNNIQVNALGCFSNIEGPFNLKNIGIPPKPQPWTNSPVCIDGHLALNATDSIAGLTFSWAGPNGFSATGAYQAIRVTSAAAAGIYTVTVANGICTHSDTISVIVNNRPALVRVSPDATIKLGDQVQLEAYGGSYYWWTNESGTLTNANINNPVARPLETTTYRVTTMNEWGCTDSASVTINVVTPNEPPMPTAFTPNNDGKNDVFRIVTPNYYRVAEFSIYNRWGKQVFSSGGNPKAAWDGTYDGEPQDMGVYYYLLILAGPEGTLTTHKGEVMLIR